MEATHVGLIAGLLTTLAFIPQVTKIYRTKSARDVSLAAFAVFTVGIALWLLYGLMIRELPIILSNGVTLLLAIAILVMKLRYK